MRNFVQPGDNIEITVPSGGITSGVGVLIGGLFGVAEVTAAQGEKANIRTRGVVAIAKTSALAINEGDSLYWDNTNRVVNKTATSQKLVGVAVLGAANPSATVQMLIIQNGAVPA